MRIVGYDRACIAIPDVSEKLTCGALNEMSCRKKWKTNDYGQQYLSFEPNIHAFTLLHNLFPDAVYDVRAEQHRESCREQVRAQNRISTLKNCPTGGTSEETLRLIYKTKPYDHQTKALQISADLPYYALFMEQGTGKTKVILDTAAHLWVQDKIQGLAIVAPNGVHLNWIKEEIPIHLSDKVPRRMATWYATPKAADKKALANMVKKDYDGKLCILAMNIDALASKRGRNYLEEFLEKFPCMLVMDEGLLIKTPSAIRTRSLKAAGKRVPYKRLLNGTPVTQGMEDLYSQMGFLSEKILGFSSYYTFKNEHCVMNKEQTRAGAQYELIVGYKNVDKLLKRVDAYSYRVTKDQCLDLPPRTYRKRFCELTKEQRHYYDAIKEEIVVKIMQDDELTVSNVLSELLRLRQVVGGFLPTDDGKLILLNDTPPKLQLLQSEMSLLHGQAIIWSCFTAELDLIGQKLKVPVYKGETAMSDRRAMIEAFQAGELKYFVANPACAATGITLTAAKQVYWYSNGFSYAMRQQADDRAHRIGQLNKVTYTDLVAVDTVDEQVIKALRNKRDIAASVTRDELKQWL